MTHATFWAYGVHALKQTAEFRLATAIDMARTRGLLVERIHVHTTAAETRAPTDIELVACPHVPRDQYRFERAAR